MSPNWKETKPDKTPLSLPASKIKQQDRKTGDRSGAVGKNQDITALVHSLTGGFWAWMQAWKQSGPFDGLMVAFTSAHAMLVRPAGSCMV